MAGRGQHFIPRHFLRPFVIPDGSNKIWLYRRGTDRPVPVDRGDVAKQRDFYSKPSEDDTPSLDDLITDYEKRIFVLVDELRALPIGPVACAETVAEVAAHLSVRSAHTRVLILEGAEGLAKALMGMVEAPASFFGIDRLPSNKAPPKIGDLLLEGITRQQFDKLSGISAETLARIVYFSLRENGPKVMVEAQRALLPIMGRLMFSPKEVASAAHVGALAQSLAPEKQVERLSKFNWQIISIGSPSAILPDCVCISRSVDGWGPLFQISSEELDLVVFPLTPEKLAVGGRDETSSIALADYNQAAASACLEFFLSSNKHPELIIHHAGLGGAPQAKNVPCH